MNNINEPSSFESLDSKSRMLLNNLPKGKIVNEPGEKVLTFSSARLGDSQRVYPNEPYQAKPDKLDSLSMIKNEPYQAKPDDLPYTALLCNDNYLLSEHLSTRLSHLNNMNIDNINNNIKNLILLSSNIDLNLFNKKKNKWVLKNKDKLLKDYEKIKKKELKSLEQIKKKELKELQQINENKLIDTHCSLSHLAQLGNNNFSVFKHKIDILDKIYDCITHIDITISEEQYMISNKNLIMQNTRIIKPENNIKNQQLSPIKIKYSIPNSSQSNNIISSNEPYQATLDKLGSSSTMMNKPGEKVKTFSSARLEETHRVFSNEQYLECFSNY
jgi:hypothetical protein